MSWNAITPIVALADAPAAIDALVMDSHPRHPKVEDAAIATAKAAAKVLLANVPGPYVQVELHHRATGSVDKDEWSADRFMVVVTQKLTAAK